MRLHSDHAETTDKRDADARCDRRAQTGSGQAVDRYEGFTVLGWQDGDDASNHSAHLTHPSFQQSSEGLGKKISGQRAPRGAQASSTAHPLCVFVRADEVGALQVGWDGAGGKGMSPGQ